MHYYCQDSNDDDAYTETTLPNNFHDEVEENGGGVSKDKEVFRCSDMFSLVEGREHGTGNKTVAETCPLCDLTQGPLYEQQSRISGHRGLGGGGKMFRLLWYR